MLSVSLLALMTMYVAIDEAAEKVSNSYASTRQKLLSAVIAKNLSAELLLHKKDLIISLIPAES